VVHAHPPTATGFALAGQTLSPDPLPETVLLVGEVRPVPCATPGTPALGDLVGVESLEHAARVLLAARAVGTPVRLTPGQLAPLEHRRGSSTHG
jgi:L-fuculose-phosphate aldolase